MSTPDGSRGWDEYADFYDWENARTVGRRDVAFWRGFVRGVSTAVLELGCGTGRVLAPLARSGVHAVGVDRSGEMLAFAQRRIRRLPRTRRPRVARADVRALPFPAASFDAVIAAYGLLQSLLTDDDLVQVLAEVSRILQPGGRFGIDLVPDLAAWEEYQRRPRLRGPAAQGRTITLVETVHQDRRRGMTIFDEEFTVRRGRRTEQRRFRLQFRTIAVPEMARRLAGGGFDVEQIAGGYDGRDWTPSSGTWLILARKR